MKREISLASGNAGTRSVEHYLIHLNYAGFGLDKLFLNCFGSPLEEKWTLVGFKTIESTERVLSSVTGVDQLHREFRITSQRTVSSFCYPAFVYFFCQVSYSKHWTLTVFLEHNASHLQVSFILAVHGRFISEDSGRKYLSVARSLKTDQS